MSDEFVKVFIRIAPTNDHSNEKSILIDNGTTGDSSKWLRIHNPLSTFEEIKQFAFDEIFTNLSPNRDVYCSLKEDVLLSFQGRTTTIIAYGPTGTGKTHTLFGSQNEHLGLISYSLKDIFEHIQLNNSGHEVKVSLLELHHNRFRPLLSNIPSSNSTKGNIEFLDQSFETPKKSNVVRARSKSSPASISVVERMSIEHPISGASKSNLTAQGAFTIKCKCIVCDMYSSHCNKVVVRNVDEATDLITGALSVGGGKNNPTSNR